MLSSAGFGAALDFAEPRRVWYSPREFQNGYQWFLQHALGAFSRRYLDVEQNSWSYLVARKLGYRASDVVIAAEDGARAMAALKQIDRVLEFQEEGVPDHFFFFFTGNDLCGHSMAFVTEAEDYGADLRRAIEYLERNLGAVDKTVDFWVLDPIGALQLAHSPQIQQKVVKAHGKDMTCRELQNLPFDAPEAMYTNVFLNQFFPKTPAGYCSTLLANKTPQDRERLAKLATRIKDYRAAIADVVKDWQSGDSSRKVQVRHLLSPGRMILKEDDIARDCFHLSFEGQVSLANLVFDELKEAKIAR